MKHYLRPSVDFGGLFILSKMEDRVGERWVSNEGYPFIIVKYRTSNSCDIKFENGVCLVNRQYSDIKRGKIKNPYHPSVYGKGYIGVGSYVPSIKGINTKVYVTWRNMLRRCYCPKFLKTNPSYKDCYTHPDWHNFQIFAKWFEENYREGYDLDKDILFKGNKLYSPKTCRFVPPEVNILFTKRDKKRGEYPIGVSKQGNMFQAQVRLCNTPTHLGFFRTPLLAFQAYKKAKEKEIKDTARVCRDIITEQVYEAMMNYKVEIND